MADTDIDAVKKRKNAERIKQYRLKRKLLMQRQASTSSDTELVQKQKKAEYDKQHVTRIVTMRINDSVLSSLKMECIRLLFFMLQMTIQLCMCGPNCVLCAVYPQRIYGEGNRANPLDFS
jgi:hypothetical protein